MRSKLTIVLFVVLFAAPAFAQTLFQGRIDATVLDAQGRAIPGVTVEISGTSSQTQVTDDKGEAHFLNLTPGKYGLTASDKDIARWVQTELAQLPATPADALAQTAAPG